MPNRLASENSPYLRQHQNNPVDWYPWSAEAFERATREDKPIFLSVGYSSCHWCHVMEHESFEDEDVAKILNEHFVSVKVDREERPDVDEAYMTAVQLSSGRGGWPMSVFMTPDRKPFFAGTYFPKDDRGKYPGFKTVLRQLVQAWRSERAKLQEAAEEFGKALNETFTREAPGTFDSLDAKFLNESFRTVAGEYDPDQGGFGGAPKFPPHSAIEFMLAYAAFDGAAEELREAALGMSLHTLEKIALGGIHDHVGGGFHRYSTDQNWLLPHFEKMLYDNALLLANFGRAAALSHGIDPRLEGLFARAAQGIVDWALREMMAPDGTFYSALDADSEGEEGKFYVWTVAEVRALLGDASDPFLEAYGFQDGGNFADEATGAETGVNIPHLKEDVGGRFERELAVLQEARERRVRPGLDDKVLVAWNGLMISGLVEAGLLPLAERAAQAILDAERRHGRLPHQIFQGEPSGDAFSDGYAYMVAGLLSLSRYRRFLEAHREELATQGYDLGEASMGEMWHGEAARLADQMVRRFFDERGGFFASSEEHEMLFGRTMPVFDQPMPSANGIAIRCLIDLGDMERARLSFQRLIGWMQRAPQATEAMLASACVYLSALSPEERPEERPGERPGERPEQASTPAVSVPKEEPTVQLAERELRADDRGRAAGEVVIRIPEGLHINSPQPPARWLTPTEVRVEGLRGDVQYPQAENDQYVGEVRIPFTVEIPEGRRDAEFEVRVSYQACTESECLLPKERALEAVAFRG
jgi:uncharacterized protein